MFIAILAMDENNGIGKNNSLPWSLKKDMKHFKETTSGGIVLMGRKTYESIPKKFRPLPNRVNIILTRNKDYKPDNVIVIHDLKDIEILKQDKIISKNKDIFVIGGAEIYKQVFNHPKLKSIILTKIYKTYECDVFLNEEEIPKNLNFVKSLTDFEEDGTVFEIVHYDSNKTSNKDLTT